MTHDHGWDKLELLVSIPTAAVRVDLRWPIIPAQLVIRRTLPLRRSGNAAGKLRVSAGNAAAMR